MMTQVEKLRDEMVGAAMGMVGQDLDIEMEQRIIRNRLHKLRFELDAWTEVIDRHRNSRSRFKVRQMERSKRKRDKIWAEMEGLHREAARLRALKIDEPGD